jgi:hypothetical protein
VPALLNYLERTVRALDPRGEEVAQVALQMLTGSAGERDPRAWRDFWRDRRSELLDPPRDPPY